MNYLGLTLLWCAIQVTIFAVAAVVLYLSMRRRSPAARSTVLASSLVSVILLTGLAWSPWPRWVPESSTAITASEVPVNAVSGDNSPVPASAEPVTPLVTDASESTAMLFLGNLWDEMKHAPAPPVVETTSAWTWQAIVAWLFLGVFALGMIRLISGILAVRRYRTHSHPIDSVELGSLLEELQLQLECRRLIELRASSEVASPATIGWRKPIILLPLEWQEWNQQERIAVIAHEVAHIKRFDFPAWFAAQVGVVLHYYHPVVHWLAGRLRLEQELAADAAAAEVLGGNSNYLNTLAGMALRRDDRSLNWAARMFLPTRHTFIRRIEMLRRRNVLFIRFSSVGRTVLAGLMLAAAVFAAGWRSPFETPAVARQPTETAKPAAPSDTSADTESGAESADGKAGFTSASLAQPLSLAYVPRDSMLVMAARPAAILSQPAFAPIKKAIDDQDGMQELLGIDVRKIRQVTVASLPSERSGMPDDPAIIVHFNQKLDQQALLTKWLRQWEEKDLGTQKYYQQTNRPKVCAFPDSQTAIFAQNSADIIRVVAAGERGAAKANWIDSWNRVSESQAAGMIDLERMRVGINQELPRGPQAALIKTFSVIWEDGNRFAFGVTAGGDQPESLAVNLFIDCKDGRAAQVAATIDALLVLARNGLSAYRADVARRGGEHALMEIKAADMADEVIDQTKFQVNDDVVFGQLTLGEETAEIVGFLIPAITQARVAAKRTQSMNNLKQIALAMHNYHDTYKHLPPAVVLGPDGKTPHSWRVELLPFLDNQALYNEYRMNEPWDSEHNQKLLTKIPLFYRSPMDTSDSTNTSYFALTGKDTSFEGTEGLSFAKFTDGLSNTLMVVESKKAVPWTKPEDIPIDLTKELPEFGGWYEGGFVGQICDGSVKFIADSIDPKILKLLIQRNDGQPIPNN